MEDWEDNCTEGTSIADDKPLHTDDSHDTVQVRYEFVENIATSAARSHAMRMYWRKRANARESRERDSKTYQPSLRPLLPNNPSYYGSEDFARRPSDEDTLPNESAPPSTGNGGVSFSEQLWAGIEFTFDLALKQKTECFSFRISAEHRKLFYHWLSIHAEEVHSGLQHQTFTPFKDVWIPLDLSNAASFNAIMAHAAAHFFGCHGQDLDLSSLKYKTEAIALINKWLSNATTALNDEVFAGVLRLLIFERRWGTRDRFLMHKEGLRQMVQAKGGYKSFDRNWRLQMVLVLLSGLERTQSSPPTVSLLKELEGFVYEALGLSHQPDHPSMRSRVLSRLQEYTSLKDALQVMRQERLSKEVSQRDATAEHGAGSGRLESLLFISAVLLEREEEDTGASMEPIIRPLKALDAFLLEFRHVWVDSSKDLIYLIWNKFATQKEGAAILQSVVQITEALKEVGHRAAWGFEQCLLECLRK